MERPKAPLIAGILAEVRKMILEGKYVDAAKLASQAAADNGTPDTLSGNPPHPAIMLTLTQPVGEAKDYLFTLDMRTSLVTTRWEDAGGIFKREMFTSRADDMAVLRVTAPAGRLNMTLKGEFSLPRFPRERVVSSNYVPGGKDRYMTSEPIPPEVVIRHTRNGILLSGVYAYNKGGFTVVVRAVILGGKLLADENGLHVEGSDLRRSFCCTPGGIMVNNRWVMRML